MKRFIILTLLFLPSVTFAAATYELIAPISGVTSVTTLGDYLLLVFRVTIGIAGVLAVLMIVICGVKLIGSGSVSGRSEAKECIWNAIFGVLLVLGSWILLNTINPLLLNTDLQIGATASAPAGTVAGPTVAPMPTSPNWYFRYKDAEGNTVNSGGFISGITCSQAEKNQDTNAPGSIVKKCWPVFSVASPLDATEKSVRNALCGNDSCVTESNKNVYINRDPCQKVGDKSCTDVRGLPNSAVNAIISLQAACGCKVVITGGTEYWSHGKQSSTPPPPGSTAAHAPGNAVFDLHFGALTNTLGKTITANGTTQPKESFKGNKRYLYNGFWYTNEQTGRPPHWHVCIAGATASYCN